ncbi:hypothetical protein B9G54_07390 [Alloscardovia macacae]|uniref:ABC transporter domain-containing protein n=1 Tax=Alloscardovia macacae TaxID=1160091 RepID=A0A1Y2SSE0_9BIFI|nr:ABC transporter ATP-binding protein [Alloscardovia macacae]OTA25569.1 hypothetical protein B9G54_07390 [Alloscardovia macacae]OTA28146.1 hypothetical protein B9T39_07410 [Alloscardovia macacae]
MNSKEISVLDLKNITRAYTYGRGKSRTEHTVLHNLNMQIRAGEIFCLVGPNGAGKTTTVKVAGTLLAPNSGSVRVAGVDAVKDPRKAREHMALLLGGENGFYRNVSAYDNLQYFADLAGVPYAGREKRIQDALESVNLADKAQQRVQTFSRGMWQRLHIARALITHAQLVLLDEPTMGLDPESARHVRSLIQGMQAEGTAILMTTHEMSEVERLADTVAVIREGRIIARGTVDELATSQNIDHMSVYSCSSGNLDGLCGVDGGEDYDIDSLYALDGVQWYEAVKTHGLWTVTIAWSGFSASSARASAEKTLSDYGLQLLGRREPSLEEVYLSILHNGVSNGVSR